MSTNVDAYIDTTSAGRVAAVLTKVQAIVPAADSAYVYVGAVRVGLNRLASTKRTYTDAQYVPQSSSGAATVAIAVEDDDVIRADAIAAARSATREAVVSAAVCTGLAMLSGVDEAIVGPFTA